MSSITAAATTRSFGGAIAIIGALFFVMGFFTWINGPLISFVQLAFDLDEVRAFLVIFVFYISYFVFALPASWLLKRTGLKKGLALALLIVAGGAALFGQMSTARWYAGALSGLFVIGGGLALLQTAANPYISILGPIESAAKRIAIMGICNKVAGLLAPVVLGAVALRGMGDFKARAEAADPATRAQLLDSFAAQIHGPYLVMAAVLAVAAVAILFSPLPEIRPEDANAEVAPTASAAQTRTSVLQFPHLLLGVLTLFVYVGVEVLAGDAIGTYGNGFALPLDQTKYFTSFTLAAMLIGYVLGWMMIPRFISQQRYLAISAVVGVLFSLAAWVSEGYLAVAFVAALGLANAMMWPAIFPLAIRGLGRFTESGSALLIMAIAGGALIPQLFAVLKQHFDFQLVFTALMVPCYLIILYYAMSGYRAGGKPTH